LKIRPTSSSTIIQRMTFPVADLRRGRTSG
jgi:hypothetical protein